MSVGDVYKIVDRQKYTGGQDVLNVYFYLQELPFIPVGVPPAAVVADQWIDQILPEILLHQSAHTQHLGVECVNLFDETDFYFIPVSGLGALAGDALGSTAALSVKFEIDTRAVKPGGKRICGIPENVQGEGILTDAAYIAALPDLEEILVKPIQTGDVLPVDTLFPIVVKRIKETGPGGTVVYRLPENQSELVFGRVLEAVARIVLGTENLRKLPFTE